MKYLIFSIFVLTSLSSFSQQAVIPKSSTSPYSIGINISPDYAFRKLINNGENSIDSFIIESRNDYEEAKISYTAGINISYKYSEHLDFELGVQYSNKGFKEYHDLSGLVFGDMIDPRYGFTYGSGPIEIPESYVAKSNFKYLDIPVRAICNFGKKKTRLSISLGITSSIFLESTRVTISNYADGHKTRRTYKENGGYNKLFISTTASIGMSHKISENLLLRAEPVFRYGITKMIDTSVSAYLWSAGLNVSCFYLLK